MHVLSAVAAMDGAWGRSKRLQPAFDLKFDAPVSLDPELHGVIICKNCYHRCRMLRRSCGHLYFRCLGLSELFAKS